MPPRATSTARTESLSPQKSQDQPRTPIANEQRWPTDSPTETPRVPPAQAVVHELEIVKVLGHGQVFGDQALVLQLREKAAEYACIRKGVWGEGGGVGKGEGRYVSDRIHRRTVPQDSISNVRY